MLRMLISFVLLLGCSPRTDSPPSRKTISELVSEAQAGRWVAPWEYDRAREYERDSLRAWARFPLDGDAYQAVRDAEVHYTTYWRAPFTGGGLSTLPTGTEVRVVVDPDDPEPLVVEVTVLGRPNLEVEMVPESVRVAEKYNGFSVSIYTAVLNRDFRRVVSDR